MAPGSKTTKLKLPPREGNQTERRFGEHLHALFLNQEILWYAFEPIKLKLAKATFYTPDFGSLWPDGQFHFHEVKGWWREDARVKIKCAAKLFPFFRFTAVTKQKGFWEYEEIG